MNQVATTLLALLLSSFISAQMPSDGLISYWLFNGNTVDDMNYQDGISVGNVLPDTNRFGGMGCALSFDGSTGSLVLLQNFEEYNIHPDSSLSISLWYQGGSPDAGDHEMLFMKYGDGFNPFANPAYAVSLYDLNKALMFSEELSLWMSDEDVTFPPNNDWHHLVCVFEVGHWRMYYDNLMIQEFQGANAHVQQYATDIAIGTSFLGSLDDIAFYNRALTPNEIDALYTLPADCSTTSIEDDKKEEISIYPNPVSSTLNIELNNASADKLEIISLLGELLKSQKITSKQIQISVENLPTGIYILSLYDKDEKKTHYPIQVN